ncbi:MAG: serine/threonine-protein kinase [Verrucomicrobiota bacterium]|nr:serine/threonine-protein kinase [Verrucomicrobiota bacterium]
MRVVKSVAELREELMAEPEDRPHIAEHTILRRIGIGAYGEVWLARSITQRFRAVKVVWRNRFQHERTFEREFTGLQRFEPISRLHPGLVDILQVGRNDSEGYFYYVMELADDASGTLDGGELADFRPLTLAEMIQSKGRLSVAECARIGSTVAEALAFLHEKGLVHRDIKPSNIIFVEGRPKLADVGLVANLGDARSFVGTEGYIAPEGPGSPRADLYSFGKTLYEMSTGRSRLDFPDLPPQFRESTEAEAFAEINEIILRACASSPAERHQSAEEIRGELLLLDAGKSIRRLRRNERLIALWRQIALISTLLIGIGLAGFLFERKRAELAQATAEMEGKQRRALEEKELKARENLYAADINLAQQAIMAGNYGRAENLLASYLPKKGEHDLRGLEWYFLQERIRGQSIGIMRGHEQVVSWLALNRKGDRLYSSSFDSTIREWHIPELRELRRWSLPGSYFMTFALDATDSFVAGEGGNRPLTSLLELSTGKWRTNYLSASPSVSFTPEGTGLARGASTLIFSTNGYIEILNRDLIPERTLPEAGGRLRFSPRGKILATGSWGNSIKLWTWPALQPLHTLANAGTVMAMSFSPDENHLAAVSRDGRLIIWEVTSGTLLMERFSHNSTVIWTVAYSPDGKKIATGGSDQTIRIWDALTLEELHLLRGHGSEVWTVLWSPERNQIFSAGKDKTIRVWNVDPPSTPAPLPNIVQASLFSMNGKKVVSRSREGIALIREVATGKVLARYDGIGEVGPFIENDSSILLFTWDGLVESRSLISGEVIESKRLIQVPQQYSRRLFSPDGRWFAFGLENGDIYLYDLASGTSPRLLSAHQQMIVSMAFSTDGEKMLSGSIDRTARLWDLASGKVIHEFSDHQMGVGAVAFSPDGTLIATGSWDDTVHIWDAATNIKLMSLSGHEGGVQAVSFAPDNRTLLSISGASALKFWSLPAEREAAFVQLPQGVGQSWLSVSHDGQWIAAVSQAEVLTLMNAPRQF